MPRPIQKRKADLPTRALRQGQGRRGREGSPIGSLVGLSRCYVVSLNSR
jgi:hypothetical protein